MSIMGRAVALVRRAADVLSPVSQGIGGWFPIIRESFAGAWQRNIEVTVDTALSFHAVYACVTLIQADIGKLRPALQAWNSTDGIWQDTQSNAFSPVLAQPNRYQNHIQFKEWWITSKLIRGNAYALKQRDNRGIVVALYLLDPSRVQVLVAQDGAVFYDLGQDNLTGIAGVNVRVPASEIIHDRMNCLFHPLVGTSPIFACGMAAEQGLRIQRNSANFFANASMPGGVLLAPEKISDTTAKTIADYWNDNFGGAKSGKVAALGDNMKFQPLRMTAVDSQMIEQLKWSADVVCSTFHVPGFMVGIGAEPAFSNGETRTGHYYSQCLQSLIESYELCLGSGLGLDTPKEGIVYRVNLDLDGLMRMDSSTLVNTLKTAVDGALLTPNEARQRLQRKKLPGGDTVYMQQQNYSMGALAQRDANDPFPKPSPAPAPALPAADPGVADAQAAAKAAEFLDEIRKGFAQCLT